VTLDIAHQTLPNTLYVSIFHICVLEQAVLRDGESVGEPKFKISCSKVHKTFRAKDYSYMTAMIADVLSSVFDSEQDMDMTANPTQERLSIFQTQQF